MKTLNVMKDHIHRGMCLKGSFIVSHDVTSVIFVLQNNEMAALLACLSGVIFSRFSGEASEERKTRATGEGSRAPRSLSLLAETKGREASASRERSLRAYLVSPEKRRKTSVLQVTAMLSQTGTGGIEAFSHPKIFFCSNKFT